MNTPRFALSCLALFCGFGLRQVAAETVLTATPTAAAPKSGYNVLVEVNFNEAGVAEGTKVVESDDFTGGRLLESMALSLAANIKQAPKMKDGKAVKFTARAPFNFPVEDDEGPAAQDTPKPGLNTGLRPVFPESMITKGENGGVILELQIGSFGNVQSVKVLRSTHKEYADAAVEALKTWIFMPAQKDGVNVECRCRVAIGFSVDGKQIDWKWRIAPRPSIGSYVVFNPKLVAAAAAATPTPLKPVDTGTDFSLPATQGK